MSFLEKFKQRQVFIMTVLLALAFLLFSVSLRWTALPLPQAQHGAVPYQRYGHTAVCFMDCAYIWGGRNNEDGACNILYCFDMGK